MKREDSIRADIIAVCQKIYQNGFVAANDGNVSVKLSDNRILVTPTGRSKGSLTQKELLVIDSKGRILKGNLKPTSELPLVLYTYQKRKDIKATVHAHPLYSTSFSVAGIGLPKDVLPEIFLTLGEVPLAKYGTPSTVELANSVSDYIKDHDAILLKNHGVLTLGKDVEEAYYKLERVEHFAHILWLAIGLGRVDRISKKDMDKLLKLRRNTGV
ncbi:MAG: class II aldolase/adducin family protein [candidate division Zixibacteria bacterium]|nr:class II aldolase/adducin family protein [candidate division Zixibacteria bacterium]